MKFLFKSLLILFATQIISNKGNCQIIKSYTLSQLSGSSYKTLSDSLKKNKDFPVVFTNRKTQKEFEKNCKARNEQIAKALDNNNYVKDTLVLAYIQTITNELIRHNVQLIPYTVTVLLDRSEVPNATSFGSHIISLNAGIILSAKNREELALYIAHELSHDILNHTENAMKERAEIITSVDYEESLKNVLNSKYGRYSQLMKITENISFDRNRHSRNSEQAADSLAIVLLKNSNISFDASCFLNLDTMGNQYEWNLKNDIRGHIKELKLTVDENWFAKKSKGLSGMNHNFADTSSKNDSLKTHPDCKIRYEQTLSKNSTVLNKTGIPKNVKEAAFEIAIMNLYANKNITRCFYRLMQEKEANEHLQLYGFMTDAIFNSLLVSVKSMERFNVLRIRKKKDVSSSYFELQNFLEQIPEKNLTELCSQLNSMHPPYDKEAQGLLEYLKIMNTNNAEDKKTLLKNYTKNYTADFPDSIYLELF